MNPEQLKSRIQGPVFPILIPFLENGEVDYRGVESYARFLVDSGARVLMLTAGTSRLNLVTTEELQRCNEALVQAAGDAALAIASGPMLGGTVQHLEVLKHAESVGAEAALLVYPERWYGDVEVASFFEEVAGETGLGLLVHAVPMRDGFGGVRDVRSLDANILERVAALPNVVGVKEENGDRAVFEEILRRLGDRLAVIGAGGAMRRFLRDKRLGSTTYLVGVESFLPKVGLEFHAAAMADDTDRARQLALHEDLYFEFAVPLGWHRVLKETLAILGLMSPHERRPLTRIPEADRARLRDLIEHQDWSMGLAMAGVAE